MSDPTTATPATESSATSDAPSSPETSPVTTSDSSATPSASASVPAITQADLDDEPESTFDELVSGETADPTSAGASTADALAGPTVAASDSAPAAPSGIDALSSDTAAPEADPTEASTSEAASTSAASAPSVDDDETPVFDSTVSETTTDPSPSLETSGSNSSDSSTSPTSESSPAPLPTSSQPDEEDRPPLDEPIVTGADQADAPIDHDEHVDPQPETSPSNSAGDVDASGAGIVPGKDGSGPVENQPTLDGSGAGVDPSVSLSPTADGGFSSDEEQEVDTTPVLVDAVDEYDDEPAVRQRSFGTPIDPTFEAATTGYTPRFRATLRPNGVIEVQRADWIGPEVLTIDVNDVEELTLLLQKLAEQA